MAPWRLCELTTTMIRRVKRESPSFVDDSTLKCDVCGKLINMGDKCGLKSIKKYKYYVRCLEHYEEIFFTKVRTQEEQEAFMKTGKYQDVIKHLEGDIDISTPEKPRKSKSRIYKVRYTEGQYLKVKELADEGLSNSTVSQITGVPRGTVQKWKRRDGNPFAEGRWVTIYE